MCDNADIHSDSYKSYSLYLSLVILRILSGPKRRFSVLNDPRPAGRDSKQFQRRMEGSKIFCALPTELVGTSVFSFLDVVDLVRIELAFGKHGSIVRSRLLEATRLVPPFDLSRAEGSNLLTIKWAIDLGLQVGNVSVVRDHNLILSQLAQHSSALDTLKLDVKCNNLSTFLELKTYSVLVNRISRICVENIVETLSVGALEPPVQFLGVKDLRLNVWIRAGASTIDLINARILKACPNITELHVGYENDYLPAVLCDYLVSVGRQLLVLEIDSLQSVQAVVDAVGQCCPQLQQLILIRKLWYRFVGIALLNLKPIANGCRSLQKLTLTGARPVDGSFEALLQNCRELRTLHMNSVLLDATELTAMAQAGTALEALHILWASTDREATASASHIWTNLHSLAVDYAAPGSIDSLAVALSCMHTLQELTLRLSCQSESSLCVIAQSCFNLTKLNITFIKDGATSESSLCTIAECCVYLRSFVLSAYFDVSDALIVTLGRSCPSLETIDFRCNAVVTDTGIAMLAQGCYWLRQLSLDAQLLTDASLRAFALWCPHLAVVELPRCQNLTESEVVRFIYGARKLRKASFYMSNAVARLVRLHKGKNFILISNGPPTGSGSADRKKPEPTPRKQCAIT